MSIGRAQEDRGESKMSEVEWINLLLISGFLALLFSIWILIDKELRE